MEPPLSPRLDFLEMTCSSRSATASTHVEWSAGIVLNPEKRLTMTSEA